MGEALYNHDAGEVQKTAATTYASGEVIQLADGRAAVVMGLKAIASGDEMCLNTEGIYAFAAATAVVFAEGEAVYWDASANTAINLANVGAGDFFLGFAEVAKISGPLVVLVDLNPVNRPIQQKTVAAAVTLGVSDLGSTVLGDTQAGAFSITLPPAASCTGRRLTFIRAGSGTNALTIDADGTELINGAQTHATMDALYDTITIESIGTAWRIIASIIAP